MKADNSNDIQIRSEKEYNRIVNFIERFNIMNHNEAWGSGTIIAIEDGRPVYDFLVAENGKETVGWCIRFDKQETHIYVRPPYRKKGIGRKLLTEMASRYSVCKVVPWDNRSEAFFKKNQHLNLIF